MRNAAASQIPPYEGYVVEVGGEFMSEYGTLTAALRAGLEFKNRDAKAQVKVYDAKERA
jgi:hypothetical protein